MKKIFSEKRFILLFILLFLFTSALPLSAREKEKRIGVLNGYIGGKLVFTEIPLWNKPGGPYNNGKVKHKVKSGTPVEIVHELLVNNQLWYKVNTYGPQKGKDGWVPSYVVRSP